MNHEATKQCVVGWCTIEAGHDGVHLGTPMDLRGVVTVRKLLHPETGHGIAITANWDEEMGMAETLRLADDFEWIASALRVTALVAD